MFGKRLNIQQFAFRKNRQHCTHHHLRRYLIRTENFAIARERNKPKTDYQKSSYLKIVLIIPLTSHLQNMEIIPHFHRNLQEEQRDGEDEDYQWNSTKYPQFGSPLTRTRGTLDLSDSPEKLKDLPNSIASTLHDLNWLQTLDLSGNQLQTLDEFFILSLSKLPNLSVLDLSFNSIEELPSYFNVLFSVTSLETLNLGNNQLEIFPKILLEWTGLRHLDLHGNNISCLPNFEEGQLRCLEDLNINYNQVR